MRLSNEAWMQHTVHTQYRMPKRKIYYHTSGHRYKVGDIIGGPGKLVCLHIKPIPHGTIQEIVDSGHRSWTEYCLQRDKELKEYWDRREEWNNIPESERPEKPEYPVTRNPKPVKLKVYKVKPYKTPRWNGMNDEYRAYDTFVEIVGIEGNAKGILQNFQRKFGKTSKAYHFGGAAKKYE